MKVPLAKAIFGIVLNKIIFKKIWRKKINPTNNKKSRFARIIANDTKRKGKIK
jgi:hypothetical protein